MQWPKWDKENQRPATKMPNCPNCDEDELGMISEHKVICYFCGENFDI